MAWGMLLAPTLPAAAEPAAAGDCAPTAAVLRAHATPRAAIRTTNLELTFFSLLWSAPETGTNPRQIILALNCFDSPGGVRRRTSNLKSRPPLFCFRNHKP